MAVLGAFMVPHPPMIIPQVGRGGEKEIEATVKAYDQVSREIAALSPDTIVIASPHSIMYSDYIHISPGKGASGSFSRFGASGVRFDEKYDTELVSRICALSDEKGISAGTLGERDRSLDHGTMVPLYFIRKNLSNFRIVRIGLSGLPLAVHYELGQIVRQAAEELRRNIVFVGSGDLSHKLQDYGPYGFADEGPQYDERIMDVCGRGAFGELFDFDESFCEKAAECGHRSFVMMAGALDGDEVEVEKLSHEDVTGVGYGICTFRPIGTSDERRFLDKYLEKQQALLSEKRLAEDEYVRLARASLESFILERKHIGIPDWASEEMKTARAGVFVSIHEHDRLRGCIGTFLPSYSCIADEIINNAIAASTEDPRFDPIAPSELKWLDINVDVLSAPERISGPEELDVKRYGVIVTNGRRRGLLLPDLDGVDTVEQQISIAKKKAGIGQYEKVSLERFEVVRHR